MSLQHHERVEILSNDRFPQFVGYSGWILGISKEGGVDRGYSVEIPELDEGVWLYPHEVRGTGEIADRSLFYSGASVRIGVENDTAYLVDEEDEDREARS